jgi:alpha-1,3-rhamnosyl/mannosyltransferase
MKPSLYHETNYVPFYFEDGPTVITICDLSFIRHPEWHPIDRVKYFEKYCMKRLSRTEAIITISEFSKKEILNLLNVDPAKIYITSLGVDKTFTPGKKRMQGLLDRYLLFLGNLEPRKNLPILINAYLSLPKNLRERYPLVVAGAKAWHTNQLEKALLPFNHDEKITLTGYVPQTALPDLYRGASLFIYPSLYEGFGLPVLEAMASGVPVITSNLSSLPEVVGDAGILVDPHCVDNLREAILMILNDEEMRNELIAKGLKRAKSFSWEKCAKETLVVYEKVLCERG